MVTQGVAKFDFVFYNPLEATAKASDYKPFGSSSLKQPLESKGTSVAVNVI